MPPKRKLHDGPQPGPHTPSKAAPLAYEAPPSSRPKLPPPVAERQRQRRRRQPPPGPGEGLVFVVLDIVEEAQGRFHVWGTTPRGSSVLMRVRGFHPYFFIAAPKRQVETGAGGDELIDEEVVWDQQQLQRLQESLNRHHPPDSRVVHLEAVQRTPIMFYRPDHPSGSTYLKLTLAMGGSVRRASAAVQKAMTSGKARAEGLVWRDLTMYEAEVAPLQRFLVDLPTSGGAWLYVPAAAGQQPEGPASPAPGKPGGQQGAAGAGAAGVAPGSSDGSCGSGGGGGWRLVPDPERISSCDIEVFAPWQSVCCLTPDATQLADAAWSPFADVSTGGGSGRADRGSTAAARAAAAADAQVPPAVRQAAEAAKRGDIAGLRIMALDVLSATADGADRVPVASQNDPVLAIACTLFTFSSSGGGAAAAGATVAHAGPAVGQSAVTPVASEAAATATASGLDEEEGEDGAEQEEEEEGGAGPAVKASAAAVVGGPTTSRAAATAAAAAAAAVSPDRESLLFLLHPAAAGQRREAAERSIQSGAAAAAAGGASRVLLYGSEGELLLAWAQYVRAADPDVMALFQVNDTLGVLHQRFAALRLEGGGLQLSRLLPRAAKPLSLKRITMYSAAWVKSQSRMSSTSNQETWRCEIDGRVVVDVLRQVLTSCNLASFSLVDCVQSLLGQTLELLRPGRLAALAGLAGPPPQQQHHQHLGAAAAAEADAMRLARYTLRRCEAVVGLLHRLATVPELIEMARATGLTLGQAAYNAQMIRTHSLLLRTARRMHYLVPGRQEAESLQEHTFILHPIEAGTAGLHRQPVAILDFASLYPSIYRAHNLCYTTLVHKEDVGGMHPSQLTITPTGAAFVKPEVRRGILPTILAALIAARGATREQLKGTTHPATRSVLDSRQKALKVTANALYGFTGAGASPLQCIQLADSCLAYGAQSCRRAKEVLEAAAAEGRLAPHGNGARVIYGHTDSLFVLLPEAADAKQAISAGKLASRLVSAAFPAPMEIKFERVCLPLLLLHVNRYAGRAYEREEEAERGGGELIVKGIKSMWRQAAPILRTTLHGALVRIIMQDDIRGAADFVQDEVRRLLSGRVELNELVMTGGLWRVTGQQVEKAAAGEGGPSEEEVRGPHAALAVRLRQRDPGRSFVLGQRLPFVLLAGPKLQEDAAEDPLTAAKAGQPGDYDLYWKKKLLHPLTEIFQACLPPGHAILSSLLGGDHTRVKVDQLTPPPPVLGPASPPPTARSSSRVAAPQQTQMAQFFRQMPKCLGCRSSMPCFKAPLDDAPGLCSGCASAEGKWEETYLGLLGEAGSAEARQTAAFAACRDCHSGGMLGPVLCENGECPVTFSRLGCSSRVQQLDKQLRRLDIF